MKRIPMDRSSRRPNTRSHNPVSNLAQKFSSKVIFPQSTYRSPPITSKTSPMTPSDSSSKRLVQGFPKPAAEYIAMSPGESTPCSVHSAQAIKNSAEIKLIPVPSAQKAIRKYSTSPPSRNSSIHSKGGGYSTERPSGEREKQLEGIIGKMRTELDKYRTTIEQNTHAWKIMQTELKNTANTYMKEAQDSRVEIEKLRSTNQKLQKELEKATTNLNEANDCLSTATSHLSDSKNSVTNYQKGVAKAIGVMNGTISIADKLKSVQNILNESNEQSSRLFNLPLIERFLADLSHREPDVSSIMKESIMPSVSAKDDNNELQELRTTNAILLEHTLELERAIGEIESTKAIRDTDLCWGIKEILNLGKEKEQLIDMH